MGGGGIDGNLEKRGRSSDCPSNEVGITRVQEEPYVATLDWVERVKHWNTIRLGLTICFRHLFIEYQSNT